MRRHGVLRHIEKPGKFTSRNALRLVSHEQPERIEPGGLGERGKRRYCCCVFHISRFMDIMFVVNGKSLWAWLAQ